jgi:phage recombination protein Bet
MNTKIAVQKESTPAMSEDEMINVLGNSLYPSAQVNSIKLVIGYCKAAGLDPIQKPVHIVPMWDAKMGAMRDIIMPGIGSYRTQAARSGEYAGVSEPEFGADLTENIGGASVTYPSTCRVIVKRLLSNGAIAEFAATERWKENYAVKGGKEKSIVPNAMWTKRPYAQLAKCAEAQALRKAFPEFSGAQPTADEMEGKPLDDMNIIDHETGEITQKKEPKVLPAYTDAQIEANAEEWRDKFASGKSSPEHVLALIASKYNLTPEQAAKIRGLAEKPKSKPEQRPAIDPNDPPY